MGVLISLILGVIIGAVGGYQYQQHEVREANRERWRRYADAKRARKAKSGR